jgi:hypothetical protein
MSQPPKTQLRESYTRLKKSLEKIFKPKKQNQLPQLVMEPIRQKKLF